MTSQSIVTPFILSSSLTNNNLSSVNFCLSQDNDIGLFCGSLNSTSAHVTSPTPSVHCFLLDSKQATVTIDNMNPSDWIKLFSWSQDMDQDMYVYYCDHCCNNVSNLLY